MRIERLDVLRFGALTDKSLVFRPDARLHIVYGPNEAGKSSVLAALGDLLFGFAQRKTYDFLHDAATLRVGATIRKSDGTSLSFRRRRGSKNTLLANADIETPLHGDALAPFLGTLTRETFERAFGLDSRRLREGAAEMLEAGGDAADTLFAAASGLTGLARLRTTLDDEANRLFAPRASKDRRFYQILDRHEEARQAERVGELRANDWKTLLAEIEQHDGRLTDLRTQQADLRRNISRLQRLRELRPILSAVDANLKDLVEFDDLSATTAGLSESLSQALVADGDARRAVADAETQRQDTRDAMNLIVADDAMLEVAAEITALFARSGNDAKIRGDLPRVRTELDGHIRQISQLSQRLGFASSHDLQVRLPSDVEMAEMRVLTDMGSAAKARIGDLARRVLQEKDDLAELDKQQKAAPIDPKIWREKLDALRPDLTRVEQQQEMQTRLQGQRRKLSEEVARIVPPIDDLDRLASAALPSADTLVQHRKALQTYENTIQNSREKLASAVSELRELETAIASDEAGQPVPNRSAIAEARAARDAAFAALKDSLGSELPAPAEAVTNFESLSLAADHLADMALAEGERVSRHASSSQRRSIVEFQKAEIETAISSVQDTAAGALAIYRQLFAPAGIVPLSPDEMIAWGRSVAAALDDRQSALALSDEIAAIEATAESLRPALLEITRGIGIPPVEALPVGALARIIADQLIQLAEIWTENQAITVKREESQRRIGKIESELAAAHVVADAWSTRFSAAMEGIGLAATTTIEGANAALAVWEKLPALLGDRDAWTRRVNGMQRDIETFEQEVGGLAGRIAPDLAGRPAGEVISTLAQRLQYAQAAAAQRLSIKAQIEALEAKLTAAKRVASSASERLTGLASGLPEGTDLPAIIGRLRRRDTIEVSLEKSRLLFRDAAKGADESRVRQELAAFDLDVAEAEMIALQEAENRHAQEINEHYALWRDATRRREALETGGGVELAVFQKHGAETEIVDVAHQWVVLKLASALLGAAMERHREINADPLVARAGALLSTLTGGSLTQLVEDYDEDDHPRLKGMRKSGERLGVEALSDGTRDQLYLALRLAYLEDYARNNEPAPFVGDDIFQTFDDDRTMAGLKALAEISSSFQPILFTHQLSVVHAGVKALGSDLDLIEW
ncbi:MAG: AAA family ATPase [Devosia sp.]